MTDGNNRKKAQAVFFSLVMVLSMVGGSVALAGSAAADATSIELSDNLVQGEEEITVSGEVNENGTVNVYIADSVDNTTYNSENPAGSATISDHTQEGYEININAPSTSGEYKVAVIQSDDLSEGLDIEESAIIQVDADAPTFGNETPEDGTDVTQADAITVPIDDANTSVETITATVNNSDGDINTYEINPNTAAGDGVSWDGSDLVIEPGVENVPSIADDTYEVSVTATDEVGNQNSTAFSFTVDSVDPTSTFDLPDQPDDENENLTNDVNETVTVSLGTSGNREINDSTVSLEIEGPSYSESFDYEDDEYTNSTEAEGPAFTVNPGENEVPSLNDGEYHVTVSAEDDIGNTHTATYNFEVDLSQITATDVTLSEDDLNSDSKNPTVTVEFGEDVNASAVSANVSINGGTNETLSFDATGDRTVKSELDLGSYGTVENDSAIVNVTSAQDVAGNGLINPDDSDSQTHFEIDTDGPSVGLETLPNSGTLSGYVNVTDFVDSENTNDVDHIQYEILVAEDSNYPVDITNNAENLDTRGLLNGDHTLEVTVTDDNGNTDSASADFTLENDQSLIVAKDYLEGGFDAFDHEVSEESITVSDLFESTPMDTEYTVDGEDANASDVINADENRGQVVSVTASSADEGEERTVTLDFGPLVGVESVEGDTVDVGIESNEELDELNVTLETTDSFYEETERSYTIEHFDETETASGNYIYSLTAEDLRDGDYTVTVDDAVDVDHNDVTGATDLSDSNDDATVDAESPQIVEAYVTEVTDGGTSVDVRFSEPLGTNPDLADMTFGNDRAAVTTRSGSVSDGETTFLIEGEIQTGDDNATLSAAEGAYQDATGNDNVENDSVFVDTQKLELNEGLNYVSVPIKAGGIDLTELADDGELDDVEAVWTYDSDDGWTSFDPDAEENPFTELQAGSGYVFTADNATDVNVRGYSVLADSVGDGPTAPETQGLEPGWNFVGHYQLGNQDVDTAVGGLAYDQDVGVLGQGSGTSLNYVGEFQPGEGYWIFLRSSGLYTPVQDSGGISAPTVDSVTVEAADGSAPVTNGDEVDITVEATFDEDADGYVDADASNLGAGTAFLSYDSTADAYTGTVTVDTDARESTEDVDVYAFDDFGQQATDSGSISVDTVAPQVSAFSVDNPEGQTVEVSFDSDESLETIEVAGDGDASGTTLNASDFDESGNAEDGFTYTAELSSGSDGAFGATLNTAADAAGNDGADGESDTAGVNVNVLNTDQVTSYETIQTAVDNADTGDTLRVSSGTYTLDDENARTLDVDGLTLEGPNDGINGDSSDRTTEATIEGPLMIGADNITVDGFEIKDTDANSGGPLPGPGAVQLAAGGAYGDTADGTTLQNNIITAGTNDNTVNLGFYVGSSVDDVTITQNLFNEGTYSAKTGGVAGGITYTIDFNSNTQDTTVEPKVPSDTTLES